MQRHCASASMRFCRAFSQCVLHLWCSQGRERELAGFLQSLGSLRHSIAQEQDQTVTGIRDRIEPLRQTLDERQESLSWAAKRLADTKLAAVAQQQQQVS